MGRGVMRSMTGYGTASAEAASARVTVEIRGLNQRHLDVRLALPREYASLESELRERVRTSVERGRVDVSVTRSQRAAKRRYRVAVREDLARTYVRAAKSLGRELGLEGQISMADVLRLPELFEVVEEPANMQREVPGLRRALVAALRAFDRERRREGRHVQKDMQQRTATIRRLAARIKRRLPVALRAMRRRVEQRVARAAEGGELDAARVAQDVAALAERSDVTEELVRLDSHLGALEAALKSGGSVGKRVEFLLQEVLRELNTTGAKAGDVNIAGWVLDAKGEVEKLREQIQNVE